MMSKNGITLGIVGMDWEKFGNKSLTYKSTWPKVWTSECEIHNCRDNPDSWGDMDFHDGFIMYLEHLEQRHMAIINN